MLMKRKQAGEKVAGQSVGGQFAAVHRSEPTGSALYVDPQRSRPRWAERQSFHQLRGQDFYPNAAQLAKVPDLFNSEDGPVGVAGQICHARYFLAEGEFLMVELDRGTGEAYGILTDRTGEPKLTTIDLPAAEMSWGESEGRILIAHRDADFTPQRAASVYPARMAGRAAERLSRVEHRALESQYEQWRAHQLLAHAPEFDVETLEEHHAQGQELEAKWRARAERHGVVLHTGDLDSSFRELRSTTRADWVDTEVLDLRGS